MTQASQESLLGRTVLEGRVTENIQNQKKEKGRGEAVLALSHHEHCDTSLSQGTHGCIALATKFRIRTVRQRGC